jgi:hypothetical protein
MALSALTPEERQQLVASVGTHRSERHLSPTEVALLFQKAVRTGDSLADCAKAVSLESTSQISRFLSLLKLPADVLHLVDWGTTENSLSFSSAFELSRLEQTEDKQRAVQAVLEHHLSSSEVRQLVQARMRSGKSMDECIQVVLRMRPQIEVRHVFIGAVLEEGVRQKLNQIVQRKRDELLQSVLAKVMPAIQVSGRLGSDRFTLVGGADLGSIVKVQKTRIEKDINTQLGAGI